MKHSNRSSSKKWILTGIVSALMLTSAGCSTSEIKEQAPGAKEPVVVADKDKVSVVAEEDEVKLKEIPVQVDYSKPPQEILTAYSEEGMSRFKLNYPDTFSMEYALKTIGQDMPSFSGVDMNGKKVSSKAYKGKSYVVNISKTTCAVCEEMSPLMQSLEKKDKTIDVISLYPVDKSKDVSSHRKKLKWSKNSVALVADKNAWVKELAIDKLQVAQVPTLIFVDDKGKISYTYIGKTDELLLTDMKEKAFGKERLYDFVRKEVIKVDKDGNVLKQDSLIDENETTSPVEDKPEKKKEEK